MKPYIEQFAKAVYGNYVELALASFNERKFIEDATEKIAALEAENAKLRAVVEAAKNYEHAHWQLGLEVSVRTNKNLEDTHKKLLQCFEALETKNG